MIGIVALALTLGGCAGYEVTPEVRAAEWEAKNVYPDGYRTEILAYMRAYLNDPSTVRDAAISAPALKPLGLGNRFMSCVRYGSKKSAGDAPAGKDHVAIFVGGKLDSFRDASKDQCAGAAYAPFPELEKLTRQ